MKRKPLFSILYEDDLLVAVNKTAGLTVGADRWDAAAPRLDRLLAAALAEREPEAGGTLYMVHRIDKDTSGLVVFAKTQETQRSLSAAFETRRVRKRYIAAVRGRPLWQETACDLPLVPDGDKRHRTIIDRYRGKKSLTRFALLGSAGNYSIVEARPETGRTHQIRAHLAALGHPVLCDDLYGTVKPLLLSEIKPAYRGDRWSERPLLARLGLHAAALSLPRHGTMLSLNAPLPRDLGALIAQMEKIAGKPFFGEYRIRTGDL
ncbi:MAG: RluA family pseudouridine synthase [Treponema sp.]|nr:RluA family pseudouridine synthase [Treponema sp.]